MEEKNFNENKTSLIKRSIAKFHNSQIIKTIAGLTLAGAMIVSMTGCEYDITIKPNGSDTDIHFEGTINPPNDETSNTPTNPEVGEYSELLLNVLNDYYYNNLIVNAKNGNEELYSTPRFRSHPYAFLEDEGYNIDAIRSGEIKCYSSAYTVSGEANSLYIKTRVETKANTPYYTQYLLKYNLTDQEMKDYDMLHEKQYIQACFMNDMISQMKEPTIVCANKITIEAYDNLYSSLKKSKFISSLLKDISLGGITLKYFDKEQGKFELLISTGLGTSGHMITSGYLNTVTLLNGGFAISTTEDGAFEKPSKYNEYWLREDLNTSKPKLIFIYQPYSNHLSKNISFNEN